jgi:hypothetical protein
LTERGGSALASQRAAKETETFFKDFEDFNLEEMKSSEERIFCNSLDNIQFEYHPWPQELKVFLATELNRHSMKDLILKNLQGIYLVDFSAVLPPLKVDNVSATIFS